MRVLCRHGHFAFYPRNAEEVGRFNRFFDVELQRQDDFYTFEALADLPRFSLTGLTFGNLPALETFEGRNPWEVMAENDFVYSLATGLIVPKLSITIQIKMAQSGYYTIAQTPTPIIQPGTYDQSGQQILSYDAEYDQDLNRLRVLEFDYE